MTAETSALLNDLRHRVLKAEQLRREGKDDEAEALEPTRDELIQAVQAHRASLSTRQTSRSSSAAAKAGVAKIRATENLADLFNN